MKYRKTIIKIDNLLEFKPKRGDMVKLSEICGIDRTWISQLINVSNDKAICSEETYIKIKNAIKELNQRGEEQK